jgi:siroheme decarboxylase
MEKLDAQLLNIIQSEFPVANRPYQLPAEKLGITEHEALDRVRRLAESGIIRRIGPSFDSRKLGHVSTLVAARVPAERLDEVAAMVSRFPQVTHNYGRDHEFNLWFTLICRDSAEIERVLNRISEQTGSIEMHTLPSERMFKVKVRFEF